MRRLFIPVIVLVVGALILLDFAVANPAIAGAADVVQRYLVILAAAAAVAGGVELSARQVREVTEGHRDRRGAATVLIGLGAVLAIGFFPGSRGADEPTMRWVVSWVLIPLVASLFSLLFFFMLRAARIGVHLRGRETRVMLLAAAAVIILLLPVGGAFGERLSAAAGWAIGVPIGSVFRGLLIGVALATAVAAARLLLAVGGDD